MKLRKEPLKVVRGCYYLSIKISFQWWMGFRHKRVEFVEREDSPSPYSTLFINIRTQISKNIKSTK
jgi:hypothetical protein